MEANIQREVLVEPFIIKEDSVWIQGVACIPLLGQVVSLIQEISLVKKIQKISDTTKLIELITVKNTYKRANVVRCLITIACIIAGVVAGVIDRRFGLLVGGGLCLWGMQKNISAIRENERLMDRMRLPGYQGFAIVD